MPKPQAPPLARTSAAFSAVAALRPGAGLVALLLALLLRLLARGDATWPFPDDEEDEYDQYEDEYGFDAYAFCGADRYALYRRAIGRAPHAIYVELGMVPGYVMAGVHNRGMRPRARKPRPPRHTRPVRAPPRAPPGGINPST